MTNIHIGAAHVVLEEIMKRKIRPNAIQHRLLLTFANYFDSLSFDDSRCKAPLCFLNGAGGTGKSFVFPCLEEMANAERHKIAPSGITGVCCTAISTRTPFRTTSSLFKIPRDLSLANAPPLKDAALDQFAKRMEAVKLIIVDEISFAHPSYLELINRRLKQVKNNDLDFGGVAVIVSGDFFQLPPVKADRIFSIAMKLKFAAKNANEQMNKDSTRLFTKFQRYELLEPNRCKDLNHLQFLTNMRQGDTTGLTEYIQEHILSEKDRVTFKTAPIISPGNPERYYLGLALIKEFARQKSDRVISWHLQAKFKGYKNSIIDEITHSSNKRNANSVYKQNPQLSSHFVAGAPIFLTDNSNPNRGLANGVKAEQYALVWHNERVRQQVLQFFNKALFYSDGQNSSIYFYVINCFIQSTSETVTGHLS